MVRGCIVFGSWARGSWTNARPEIAYFDFTAGSSGCERETDGEVATRRVRIGAYDMRLIDELLRERCVYAWQRNRERDIETETFAVVPGAYAHLRGDPRIIGNLHLALARDEFQGAEETGRIAGCEQLLGIVPLASRSAEFFWGNEIYVERSVGGGGGSGSTTGGSGLGAIKDVHQGSPLLRDNHYRNK